MCTHPNRSSFTLDDTHPNSAHGLPVLVDEHGDAYGPGDDILVPCRIRQARGEWQPMAVRVNAYELVIDWLFDLAPDVDTPEYQAALAFLRSDPRFELEEEGVL